MKSFLRFVVVLGVATGAWAQQVPAAGSVAGVVTCGDTQRPARFAKVTLTPVKTDKPELKAFSQKDAESDPAAAMKAMTALMSSVTMLQAQTGIDGTYKLDNVTPGDYYLSPAAPGYVSPMAAAQAAGKGSKAMAGVPVVHVEANRTARGDAVMERGAALNGTVVFDDGSPASGVVVRFEKAAVSAGKAAKAAGGDDGVDMDDIGQTMSLAMSGGLVIATTDDRGRFRMAGVPAGEYVVEATVVISNGISMRAGVMDMNAMKSMSPMLFFAPGTLHRKDAAKITVAAGEERGDIEVKVDLAGMHSVSGRVSSAVDHHGLNEATVELTDATDKEVKRQAGVDSMGNFTVSFLPPGNYTLRVSDGADTEPAKGKGGGMLRMNATHTLKSYEEASQPVMVVANDVAGVNVELKESKTTKKDIDMNAIFGGLVGGGASKDKE